MALTPCLARLSLHSTPVKWYTITASPGGTETFNPTSPSWYEDQDGEDRFASAQRAPRTRVRQPSRDQDPPSPRRMRSRSEDGDEEAVAITGVRTWKERDDELRKDAIDLTGSSPRGSAQRKQPLTDDLEGMKVQYAEQRRLAAAHALQANNLLEADDVDHAILVLDHAKTAAAEMQRIQARMGEKKGDPPAAVMVPARTGTRWKRMADKAVAARARRAGPSSSSSVPTGIRTPALDYSELVTSSHGE